MTSELEQEIQGEKISFPEVLTSEAELREFWDKLKKHYHRNAHPDRDDPEKRAAFDAQLWEKIQADAAAGGAIHLGVKAGEQIVGITRVIIDQMDDGRYGYLGGLHVDPQYRGSSRGGVPYRDEGGKEKSLATQLVETGLVRAHEAGCKEVWADVASDNQDAARSLGTLMKAGFILDRITPVEGEDHKRFFTLIERPGTLKTEKTEHVDFTDLDKITAALDSGWKGIGMKRQGDGYFLEVKKVQEFVTEA
ncbi:MAG: GNAT family N-acetyltransferase [Patescibacteria group bacterium]